MPTSSFYPGGQQPQDLSALDQQVWNAVRDLIEARRADLLDPEEHSDGVLDDLVAALPGGQTTRALLEQEAVRVVGKERASSLVPATASYLSWALRATKERNQQVLARFGVEMAYDAIYRAETVQRLADTRPTKWWWGWPADGGPRRQRCFPSDEHDHTAPFAPGEFSALKVATVDQSRLPLPPVVACDPYVGLVPRYSWSMDAQRPPLQSVRAAATIIERHLGIQPAEPGLEFLNLDAPEHTPTVLMVEPGHRVAAQALSSFIPDARVHLSSAAYPKTTDDGRPDKFDAVIVNVPHAREMAFVRYAMQVHDGELPLPSRWECDRFWQWKMEDRGSHTAPLLRHGLDHLRPGGILVVLADNVSGLVHDALSVLRTHPLRPVPVSTARHGMANFTYSKQPWGVHGALPPTGRILSAWEFQP